VNPHQFNPQPQQKSGNGCAKALVIGGGCVGVFFVGIVIAIVASAFFWERSSTVGISWIQDQVRTDVSGQLRQIEEAGVIPVEQRRIDHQDEYLSFIEANHHEMAHSLENVVRLLANPRFRDDQWSSDVAAEIAAIRQIEAQARAIEPPDAMAETHGHYVDSLHEFNNAFNQAIQAIENMSVSNLTGAIESLERASRSYDEFVRQTDELPQ
jgi:uncharacterized membrane protein YccC